MSQKLASPGYRLCCSTLQRSNNDVAQTLLRIVGVDVELVPSNNHASPSGALPFLLPPSPSSYSSPAPLTGTGIGRYARDHAPDKLRDESHPRLEAYQALLTQNVRPAWVSSQALRAPTHK
jgi:metaxin